MIFRKFILAKREKRTGGRGERMKLEPRSDS